MFTYFLRKKLIKDKVVAARETVAAKEAAAATKTIASTKSDTQDAYVTLKKAETKVSN